MLALCLSRQVATGQSRGEPSCDDIASHNVLLRGAISQNTFCYTHIMPAVRMRMPRYAKITHDEHMGVEMTVLGPCLLSYHSEAI
jgi:hypothetical protein